ncbi:MAG TPA: glycogen debranching N-terminal domain-containing protein, partial [Xanthomonadaceae bacterium]|nr:glycogen debranching N-terminal domain-containing protein [Xanthomonadaceae bacterium]
MAEPAATAASFTTHVLKDADSFLVANAYGDVQGHSDGLFHDDTRLLSLFRLLIAGQHPELLSSAVTRDNVFFVSHLTNQPLPELGAAPLQSGLVHIVRTRFLGGDRLYEHTVCRNYGQRAVHVPLRFEFAADFRDMFEVRGCVRAERGEVLVPRVRDGGVQFAYRGLDGRLRTSAVDFSRPPARLDTDCAEFALELPP